MRREVENTAIDARKIMADDPQTAIQNLKLTLQNVEQADRAEPRASRSIDRQTANRAARGAASGVDQG